MSGYDPNMSISLVDALQTSDELERGQFIATYLKGHITREMAKRSTSPEVKRIINKRRKAELEEYE